MEERYISSEFTDALLDEDGKRYSVYARPLPPGLWEIVYVKDAPEGYGALSHRLVPAAMVVKK